MTNTPAWALREIAHAQSEKRTYLHLWPTNGIGLREVPAEVFELKHLRELDLSENQIRHIPPELAEMKLDRLVLWDCPLRDVNGCQNLDLDWSQYKRIEDISPEQVQGFRVEKLEKLENLSANFLHIKDLILARCHMRKIPSILSKFVNLRSLDLSRNRITDLPDHLAKLKKLKKLIVHTNRIQEIPEAISQLTELRELVLYNNHIQRVPCHLTALKKLTHLYLSGNHIKHLSENLCGLQELQHLTLSNNQILSVPEKLFNLPKLQFIGLNHNPIENPPKEIVSQGLEAIRNYHKQLAVQGDARMLEARILIVGEPGAGKTTFAKKLRDEKYPVPDPNQDSTTGIQVVEYQFQLPDESPFLAHLWDFGGQEIQYATHQFFLSPRALYVLLSNERNQNTVYDYWFESVLMLGGASPVLVVLNERDGCSSVAYDHHKWKTLYANRLPIHHLHVDFAEKSPTRRQLLREKVQAMLAVLPHVGSDLPATWPKVRKRLDELQSKNYISLDHYYAICEEEGLPDHKDADTLLRYQHDLGAVLHFDDAFSLANTVYLNPGWILDAVYALLQAPKVSKAGGHFNKNWLFDHWAEKGYSRTECQNLLQLLLHDGFEMCYQLPHNKNEFIAPQLLPAQRPDNTYCDDKAILAFRFQYAFMPRGILSRLIVRLHRHIHEEKVWKNGVVLQKGEARALIEEAVTQARGDRVIEIFTYGKREDCITLINLVREEVRAIHRLSFPKLNVNEEVPLMDTPGQAISYTKLKSLRDQGISKFPEEVNGTLVYLSVSNLLAGLDEPRTHEGESQVNIHINNSPGFHIENKPITTAQVTTSQNQEASANASATASASVDFSFSQEIGELTGALDELRDDVEADAPEVAETLDEIAERIDDQTDALESDEPDPKKAKRKLNGTFKKLRTLYEDLQNPETKAGKTLAAMKDGKEKLQALGKQYNKIAQWCGTPVVPDAFLGE